MATARQTLTLLTALIGAAAASQAPEFAQQYRQRLGGAIDEIHRVVGDFDIDAARSGMTRVEALETHDAADMPLFRDRGQSMRQVIARYDDLRTQSERFERFPAAARPLVLAMHPDRTLLAGAWRNFEPALPLTVHGLIWTIAGFAAGAFLCLLLAAPFRRRRRSPVEDALRHGKTDRPPA